MSVTVVKVLRGKGKNGIFLGTAFFINKTTLVTARHVIEYAQGYDIYLRDIPNGGDLLISKESIVLCKERDVAILNLKREFEIEKVEISLSTLKVGVNVELKGYYNLGEGVKTYEHNVSGASNAQYTYELQNHLTQGLSGSPVLIDNKIVGIAQAIDRDKNITYIIPISECCYDFEKIFKKNSFKIKYIFLFLLLNFIGISYLFVSEKSKLNVLEEKLHDARSQFDESMYDKNDALRMGKNFDKVNENFLFPKSKIGKYANASYSYFMASELHDSSNNKIEYAKKCIERGNYALKLLETTKKDSWSKNTKMTINYSLLIGYLHQVELGEDKFLENAKIHFKVVEAWYYHEDYYHLRKKDIIEKYKKVLKSEG